VPLHCPDWGSKLHPPSNRVVVVLVVVLVVVVGASDEQLHESPAGVHTQASLPVLVQLQAPAWHAAIAVLKHAALDAPERPAAATSSEHALWPQAGAASALETVNGRPAPRASTPNAKNIFLASI